jgi:hypothetical protein
LDNISGKNEECFPQKWGFLGVFWLENNGILVHNATGCSLDAVWFQSVGAEKLNKHSPY